MILKTLAYLILSISCLYSKEGKFEGLFRDHFDVRIDRIALFLPCNPTIYFSNPTPDLVKKCQTAWPIGTIQSNISDGMTTLFWLDESNSELVILKKHWKSLSNLQAIYTTTHFLKDRASNYKYLKAFLEANNFKLLTHWYWEGEFGHALFLRRDVHDAAMKSLSFSPNLSNPTICNNYPSKIENHLRRESNKSEKHSFPPIDFIYMINLDERPEKFASAATPLQTYGIHPYRFSAVNGWKLTNAAIQEVGVRFKSKIASESFLGTTYREIDGKEYQSNEKIEKDGTTYFALGMSRGAIGIAMSHISVLQDAYNSGYETIWVMEDDVQIVDSPLRIPALISQLDSLDKDWDILFTDIDQTDKDNVPVPCRSLAMRPNYKIDPLADFLSRFYSLNKDFSRVGMRFGAYSMIIRRSGIEKILAYFKAYGIFLPYDMDFWLIPDLKMYRLNYDIIVHNHKAITDNGKPNYTVCD